MGYPPVGSAASPIEMAKTSTPVRRPSASKATTLGKRPRSPSPVNPVGYAEDGRQAELSEEERARTIIRPSKKRAKMTEPDDVSMAGPSNAIGSSTTDEVAAQLLGPRLPAFTVFRGPEEYSSAYRKDTNAPPLNPLPEIYRPPTPLEASSLPAQRMGERVTSSTNEENKKRAAFDFTFDNSYTAPIPFPEPPGSPSPASHTIGFLAQLQTDRTDPFREFGFPSPRRPRQSSATAETSRAGALSNDVGAGLGLTPFRGGSPGVPEASSTRKTMYGTELEGNTRFGDFGVEGVASEYWSVRR